MKACCDCAVWAIGFNEQIFAAVNKTQDAGKATKKRSAL
jgi:hypothetical protein